MDPISASIMGGSAILGSGLNYLSGASATANSHKANNAAQKTLAQTAGYADTAYNQGSDILATMLAQNGAIYGSPEAAALALKQAQNAVNGVQGYDAGTFNYEKDIDDFYDNALGLRMNAANDAINQSQAVGGNLFSSDTANKLVAQAQVLGSEAYRDAMQAYTQDKSMDANIWNAEEAARQAEAQSNANLAQMKYGMASDTAGNIANANNAYYEALLGINDDFWQNKADFVQQMAGLQSQDAGGNFLTWLGF